MERMRGVPNMSDSQFTINSLQLQSIRKSLDAINPSRRDSLIKGMMIKVGAVMERALKDEVSSPKGVLKRRTGRLANSIGFQVNNHLGNWQTEIGSGVRTGNRVSYANILETGGIIKPKKSRYLAIPLTAALTKSGAPKKSSPMQWASTFVKRSHAGNLIIFQSQSGGRIVPLYVLKKSVRIPKKEYLSETVRKMREKVFQIINNEISDALRGA